MPPLSPKQMQLFDPATTRPQGPGERSFDDWLQQPGIQFHGTYRSDFHRGDITHFGTLGQAAHIVHKVGNALADPDTGPYFAHTYYSGETASDSIELDEQDYEPSEHKGQVFARRIHDRAGIAPLRDAEANAAHAVNLLHRKEYEPWEVPESVKGSAGSYLPMRYGEVDVAKLDRNVLRGANRLNRGQAIPYVNEVESQNVIDERDAPDRDVSWAAPSGSYSSWEGEVNADPYASPIAKRIAAHKQSRGIESAVFFPSGYHPADGVVHEQLAWTATGGSKGAGQLMNAGASVPLRRVTDPSGRGHGFGMLSSRQFTLTPTQPEDA